MALTQSDADAIKRAIASGVKSVSFADGRRVDYQSVAEMKEALALAQADIAAGNGSATSSVTSFCRD